MTTSAAHKPLRVRAYYTRYPHWGAHTGFHQVCAYVDPRVASIALHAASDSHEDWPIRNRWVNARIRSAIGRRGMLWYKLSDFAAEVRAWPSVTAGRADVVHYFDAEHGVAFLPDWLSRRRRARVRLIGTFHQPARLLPELVSRAIAGSLDMVLTVAPSQEEFFREFMPSDRVRTILHGVDTAFFTPAKEARDSRPFRCITVGHWQRDWTAMRAVVERFQGDGDIEFHVVTAAEPELPQTARVVRHRNVDDETLRRLYQQSDLLLLPLVDTTANNSLLEGMASGLPVVSTRLPAAEVYAAGSDAELVDRNDVDALVSVIQSLREDEARRERMCAASRGRAEQLAWPRVASELERLYRDLT